MTSLPAWDVEYARSNWQTQDVHQACRLLPIALGSKKCSVLQEIVVVESGLPPLARLFQKKTGSR